MTVRRTLLILLAVMAGAPAAASAQAHTARSHAAPAAAAPEPTGTYDITFEVEGFRQPGTLVIVRADGRLTGTMTVHDQPMQLSVVQEARKLTLATVGPHGQMNMTLTFDTDDRLAGTFANQEMSGKLVAVRRRPAAR